MRRGKQQPTEDLSDAAIDAAVPRRQVPNGCRIGVPLRRETENGGRHNIHGLEIHDAHLVPRCGGHHRTLSSHD